MSPIDGQGAPRNSRSRLRSQKRRRLSEFLGPGHAPLRQRAGALGHDLIRRDPFGGCLGAVDLSQPIGVGQSGQQRIDGDTVPCHLARQSLEKRRHSGPEDIGENKVVDRFFHADRRNADDPSPFALPHPRQHSPYQAQGGFEQQVIGPVPLLFFEIGESTRPRPAGVGYQDFDLAKPASGFLEYLGDIFTPAQIGRDSDDFPAGMLPQSLGRFGQRVLPPGADRHARPLGKKRFGTASADAPARSPDQCNLVLNSELHNGSRASTAFSRLSRFGEVCS